MGDEFEYPENLSREQLILWSEYFKLLIKEINEELCGEINTLSERNETLENYIELKGLPFPEDDEEFSSNKEEIQKILSINDLPHPLPSMNFIDDLDLYNPTKQQLKDYIDLMFAEWRRDEFDANKMILDTFSDKQILNELELKQNENENEKEKEKEVQKEKEKESEKGSNDELLDKVRNQLEAAYLKQEEKELEYKQ